MKHPINPPMNRTRIRPKYPLASILVCLGFATGAQTHRSPLALTFEQAVEMADTSRTMRIAAQQVEQAENEHRRLNAYWYPQISAVGTYVHLGNPIEVKESLSAFTDPLKDFIQTVVPGEEAISSLLSRLGQRSFGVPLAPPDIASINAVAVYPLFTGGKRLYGDRIGRSMAEIAEEARRQAGAGQQVLLVGAYYGVRLGQKIVEVKRQTLEAFELHYRNACKLEEAGMLTRTERLVFEVNRDEARRALETAVKELEVAQHAFGTLVGIGDETPVDPLSPLFIDRALPPAEFFKSRTEQESPLIRTLKIRQEIQKNRLRIANSAYLPEIGIFWQQTLYSHGLRKNLAPRWLAGVGFTWNLFDGLGREKQIRQARIGIRTAAIEHEKASDDLALAIDKFYSQTQIALDNVRALRTTLEMCREIVRARKKSFAEGMATTAEVVDAELLFSQTRVAVLTAYYQFDTALIGLLAASGMADTFAYYGRKGENEEEAPIFRPEPGAETSRTDENSTPIWTEANNTSQSHSSSY